MVLDRLTLWRRYESLHPGFTLAFQTLSAPQTADLSPGKHVVDGDRLYLIVGRHTGRGRQGAKLESHRRYIDIQLTLAGQEEIGYLPLADCLSAAPNVAASRETVAATAGVGGDQPYDADQDVAFYAARPETWFALPPGDFAIFFPDDAHAPLAGQGEITKVVAKLAVDWQP